MRRTPKLRICCLAPLLLALGACQSTPVALRADSGYFDDTLFKPRAQPIDAQAAIAVSPDMLAYLDDTVRAQARAKPANRALLEALYSKDALQLEYDSSYTRTAAEAFEAKSGNCLSLVLMTSAFADALGIPVRYQSVFTAENVSRDRDMIYISDHVNLVLGGAGRAGGKADEPMVVDFLRPVNAGEMRAREISQAAILSMYMNNRAVEELAEDDLDDAYWWAKAAIESDYTQLAAYNTLGLVYEHRGQPLLARRALRHVLDLEADNRAALANLSRVERQLGEEAEAIRLESRLREIQPIAPFYYFDLGISAMKKRDYASAKSYFVREVNRAAYYHEFHFWLAQAYIGLNEPVKARKHLDIAVETATTPEERALYSESLKSLNLVH